MPRKGEIKDRTGEIHVNLNGETFEIIKYNKCKDVIVKFLNSGDVMNTTYGEIKNKQVRSLLGRTVYGVGFIGYGEYKVSNYDNELKKYIITNEYSIWSGMLRRCYDDKWKKKHPTYKNCIVCDEWHNFQNFAKWYEENYWEPINERVELDKDILQYNEKIYSPNTCFLVSQRINLLFVEHKKYGITKNYNRYALAACDENGRKFLGTYSTQEEAFLAYKTFKEAYIKQVADEYKSKYPNFPQKLYDAMYSYEVEITD